MAKIELDPSLRSVRGRVGNYVFRESRGRTVMSASPTVEDRKRSAEEAATQTNFSRASEYAVEVMSDPIQREEYELLAAERGEKIRPLVMRDFMTPPKVTALHLTGFNGKPGDVIKVQAWDDLEVTSVVVKITDAASGQVLESGACGKKHGVWIYRTTTALLSGQHVTIEATAWDRPGHSGSATKAYP